MDLAGYKEPKLLEYIRISCRGGNLRKEKLKLLQMKLPH